MRKHGGARPVLNQHDRRIGWRGYSHKHSKDPVDPFGEQKKFWERASLASDKLLALLRTHHATHAAAGWVISPQLSTEIL